MTQFRFSAGEIYISSLSMLDTCVTLEQWDLNVTVPKAFYVKTVLEFRPYEDTV